MLSASILGTASHLPGRPVPTEDLSRRAFPDREPADLEGKIGIHTRWFHEPGTTVASLGAVVLREALNDAVMPATALRRVLLANSHGFDRHMPATVNDVLQALDIRHTVDGFDIGNTCVGFLSGLDVAARCVATGLGPVAVVAAELPSRVCGPEDPRPYVIMGDAAGAVVLGPGRGGSGFLGAAFGNDGSLADSVTLQHQPAMAPPERAHFGGSAERIKEEVVESLRRCSVEAIHQAGLRWDDVDWFLVHQPNGKMFDVVLDALAVPRAKALPVVAEVGSIATASLPLTLDRLRRRGSLGPGQTVLFATVGSGLAYGAMLYREAQ